jgi:hypothetical protein
MSRKWVRGLIQGVDASSGAVEITLYDEDGATVTITSTDRLVLQCMVISATTPENSAIQVFGDADDGDDADVGEIAVNVTVSTGTPQVVIPATIPLQYGAKPHCISTGTAGLVTINLYGHLESQ